MNRVVTSSGIDTEYRYDGLGRVSKLIDRGLATAEDPSGTIAYHYDPLGRKARVERPNGVSSLFDYEPATGFTSQIKHEKTGGENVLTLDYADRDATGIITQIIETRGPAASQTTRDWSYTYDGLKRLATAKCLRERGHYTNTPVDRS